MTNKNESIVISLGRLNKAQGLNGDIQVATSGDLLLSYQINESISVFQATEFRDGILLNHKKTRVLTFKKKPKLSGQNIIVSFVEIEDRNGAETLRGQFLGLELDAAKSRFSNEKEPYLFEYLQVEVFDSSDPAITGLVERIEPRGNQNWLIIKCKEEEVMVPLVDAYVPSPPRDGTRLEVTGLLNLLENA